MFYPYKYQLVKRQFHYFCADSECIRRTGNVCPTDLWDVTDNGVVNADDLLTIINGWGPCG